MAVPVLERVLIGLRCCSGGGSLVVAEGFLWSTFKWLWFLLTSPDEVWTMYDLGVSAGAMVEPGVGLAPDVTHTFGIGDRSLARWHLSWSLFCCSLNLPLSIRNCGM